MVSWLLPSALICTRVLTLRKWDSTLENETLVHYYLNNFFSKNSNVYKGFRFDDPLFTIKFRKQPLIISKKDKEYKNITLY